MINDKLPTHAGEVSILNVGDGDTKLSFDPNNPMERIRAARIVKDMLRRGYALMIQLPDGSFQRARGFDENVCEYIIADFDPLIAAEADANEDHQDDDQQGQAAPGAAAAAAAAQPRRTTTRRVKAEGARAVAVGRVSGG